ncbi:glutathione ABC transporter substrate-binding protein [Salipaludibacillus aurantiacus]|uniref:Peptide/nickel transport system substrate-binding protein n=1 Tax=Salipaludibacillus aurantiacus TaxID=1601833 RepID=A0A1H9S472_9BACI|nr:glutathione ABC transporter substrate-binding protein [Salipaludibacillus aurantiacus]SER79822.1 peptide/nickel transport system substrate-binding protein [Salipaludibacillus aurantiacus]
MKHWYLVAGALAVLTGCAGNGEPPESEETANAPDGNSPQNEEIDADPDALTVNMQSDVSSLDPHFGNDHASLNVKRTIYDTLVRTDEDLDIHMSLAESFEQEEPDVWEVSLREDVTFHDGTEFNADAVKVNVERMLDEETASPVAFMFEMIEEVEVVDDYTVRFYTEYPFAPLKQHFAHPAGQMISPALIEEDQQAVEDGEQPGSVINENPVGTGFYKFDSQQAGEEIHLVKNDDYFDGEAGADELTFRIVPEDLTRVGELETDSAQIIGHLNPNDISRLEENEETKVARHDSASLAYFGFNTEVEPFDDPDVRRAIAMAINKDDIVEGVMGGAALKAEGPLAPPVTGASDNLDSIEENVDEARDLLAEAGYEDGIEAELWTDDSRVRLDTAELIQSHLAQIGVNVEIVSMESGAHREQVSEGEHELFLGSWGTVTGDADYGLYPVFHSDSHGMTGNRMFYSNEEVDALLDAARQKMDPDERDELYHEAQQIIVDEAPMVPLYHIEHLAGLRSDIENFYIHPSSLYEMVDVTRTIEEE